MSRFIILPTPLPPNSIGLGQLITDPINAEAISFYPSTKPAEQISSTQSKYQQTIAHDEHGRFLFPISDPNYSPRGSLLTLSADESSYTTLNHPKATFDAVRRDAAAQAFLRKTALNHQPLYYVTGIQTLKAPSLKHAGIEEGNVAEAPASEFRLPMHVRRVDSVSNIDTDHVNEKLEDSIFAVELMKVRCRVGAASEPHSLSDIGYDWTYHTLDGNDLQLSIGLGQVLKTTELSSVAGIVAGEDYTDDSWDSRSEDDDGLGGF